MHAAYEEGHAQTVELLILAGATVDQEIEVRGVSFKVEFWSFNCVLQWRILIIAVLHTVSTKSWTVTKMLRIVHLLHSNLSVSKSKHCHASFCQVKTKLKLLVHVWTNDPLIYCPSNCMYEYSSTNKILCSLKVLWFDNLDKWFPMH